TVLAPATGPVVIDLGFAEESASPRVQAIDRAELLASSAELVGSPRAIASAPRVRATARPELLASSAELVGSPRAIASATRVIGPDAVASAVPFLQPLGLSASTRRRVSSAGRRG